MTWQGVPWSIGGGALVPIEVARLLAYCAIDGEEGVITPGDCAVLPTGPASAAVRIMPGAVGILNRFEDPIDGGQQAYLVRQPSSDDAPFEVVPITPTGAGRTDLIAVVVEDPQYDDQPDPASVQNGPYVRTRVYEGVSAGVTRLEDVDPGQSGYALAKITRPALTANVTAAHITDLRTIPNPRVRQVTKLDNATSSFDQTLTSVGWSDFPSSSSWNIAVPKWAATAHLELYIAGVRVANDGTDAGDWAGVCRLALGSIATDQVDVKPSIPNANKGDTFVMIAANEVDVPPSMRGTAQTLSAQGKRNSVSSGVTVKAAWGTVTIAKVTFFEKATSDVWEI